MSLFSRDAQAGGFCKHNRWRAVVQVYPSGWTQASRFPPVVVVKTRWTTTVFRSHGTASAAQTKTCEESIIARWRLGSSRGRGLGSLLRVRLHLMQERLQHRPLVALDRRVDEVRDRDPSRSSRTRPVTAIETVPSMQLKQTALTIPSCAAAGEVDHLRHIEHENLVLLLAGDTASPCQGSALPAGRTTARKIVFDAWRSVLGEALTDCTRLGGQRRRQRARRLGERGPFRAGPPTTSNSPIANTPAAWRLDHGCRRFAPSSDRCQRMGLAMVFRSRTSSAVGRRISRFPSAGRSAGGWPSMPSRPSRNSCGRPPKGTWCIRPQATTDQNHPIVLSLKGTGASYRPIIHDHAGPGGLGTVAPRRPSSRGSVRFGPAVAYARPTGPDHSAKSA